MVAGSAAAGVIVHIARAAASTVAATPRPINVAAATGRQRFIMLSPLTDAAEGSAGPACLEFSVGPGSAQMISDRPIVAQLV